MGFGRHHIHKIRGCCSICLLVIDLCERFKEKDMFTQLGNLLRCEMIHEVQKTVQHLPTTHRHRHFLISTQSARLIRQISVRLNPEHIIKIIIWCREASRLLPVLSENEPEVKQVGLVGRGSASPGFQSALSLAPCGLTCFAWISRFRIVEVACVACPAAAPHPTLQDMDG